MLNDGLLAIEVSGADVIETLRDVCPWIAGGGFAMPTLRPRSSLLITRVKLYYELSLDFLACFD